MNTQQERAELFASLHRPGEPVIIFNAWDAGSAKAIRDAGAKAIATGDHPVGFAHGFTNEDFKDFRFDTYLGTIREIAQRIGQDLPLSVDISNAAGLDEAALRERITTLLDLGVVGINFEDTTEDETNLRDIDEQVARIKTIRAAADAYGVNLFINARSDLYAKAGSDPDLNSLTTQAIERAAAYQRAGASGFFAPALMDLEHIQQLASAIELPLNIIRLPGAPSSRELSEANVGRVSYGPVPQMRMIEWLKSEARRALNREE